MRHLLVLVFVLLAAAAAPARAGGDVGVVVTGDTTMQPQVLSMVEGWLRAHGHQLVASPLPPEATNKLIDCFVIEDTTCARKLVEAQAKTATVVFARVDVADNAGSGMRDVTITAYWFERGADPVAEKRSCEKCTDATLHTTADALLSALAGSGRKVVGQLSLTSTPAPAKASVDGAPVGNTPLEIALAPGVHQLTLTLDGIIIVSRTVTITQGQTTALEVPLAPHRGARSRGTLPLGLIGAGGALVITGVILYATSETDTGAKYQYRDTRALGAGVVAAGLVAAGIGTYLWVSAGKHADSVPAIAIGPHAAYLGWGKAF